jgi:hypothetical protein
VLSPHLINGSWRERLVAAPGGEITGRFYRDFIKSNPVACPAQGLIPRHVMEQVGPFITARGASDYDYHLRIALAYPVTFHLDPLVRWRYLASSVSGPHGRRWVEWAVMMAAVLGRHRTLCAAEDRPLVVWRFWTLARQAAREVFLYGAQHDTGYARSRLLKLRQLAPWQSGASLYLVALSLPGSRTAATVIAALMQACRRLRAAWRALARSTERR